MRINQIPIYNFDKRNMMNLQQKIQVQSGYGFIKKPVSFKSSEAVSRAYKVLPLFTGKLSEYSISEYLKLNNLEKLILRSEYNALVKPFDSEFFKKAEDMHDFVSDCMKESLSSKYGKDNYILVPIGRSLSSISKVLGYKIGEDKVKNIPMSDVGKFADIRAIDNIPTPEINSFKTYLDSIGLTKNFVSNTDKTIVLTDFCSTGQSLHGANNLFKSESLFGADAPIESVGLDSLIPKTDDLISFKINLNLNSYLIDNRFKAFSFVSKCPNLSDTEKSVVIPQKANRWIKLFWFKLLDNFMTGKKADKQSLSKLSPSYRY